MTAMCHQEPVSYNTAIYRTFPGIMAVVNRITHNNYRRPSAPARDTVRSVWSIRARVPLDAGRFPPLREPVQRTHRHGNHFCDTAIKRQSISVWRSRLGGDSVFVPKARAPQPLDAGKPLRPLCPICFFCSPWLEDGAELDRNTKWLN